MNLADILLDGAIAREIDLMRYAAHLRARVVRLVEKLAVDVMAQLLGADELSRMRKQQLENLLEQIAELINTDYTGISRWVAQQLRDLAIDETRWALRELEASAPVTLGVSLPPRSVLTKLADETMIQGAPNRDWWERQAADTRFRFIAAIRQGVAQGEANRQIVARIRDSGGLGEVATSRRNAEALVRTAVQTVSAAARLEAYRHNSDVIKGVQQVSTLDARTTEICMAYDGAAWDLEGNPIMGTTLPFAGGPPRHWNCRSTLIPITKSFKELGLDMRELAESTRASMDGQVAARVRFSDWLKGKSKDFQDEVLGSGRAELWRAGKISLAELLDSTGRPLTLAQLRKKYGR